MEAVIRRRSGRAAWDACGELHTCVYILGTCPNFESQGFVKGKGTSVSEAHIQGMSGVSQIQGFSSEMGVSKRDFMDYNMHFTGDGQPQVREGIEVRRKVEGMKRQTGRQASKFNIRRARCTIIPYHYRSHQSPGLRIFALLYIYY